MAPTLHLCPRVGGWGLLPFDIAEAGNPAPSRADLVSTLLRGPLGFSSPIEHPGGFLPVNAKSALSCKETPAVAPLATSPCILVNLRCTQRKGPSGFVFGDAISCFTKCNVGRASQSPAHLRCSGLVGPLALFRYLASTLPGHSVPFDSPPPLVGFSPAPLCLHRYPPVCSTGHKHKLCRVKLYWIH